jgi:hypothetical protein
MNAVCALCGAKRGQDDPARPVSHGICSACSSNIESQKGIALTKFLDALAVPVLAVDSDAVVKIANSAACARLNKPPADVQDKGGGEVFECAYARRSGGCGRDVHCSGCTIRNLVSETYRTGQARVRVPAYLCQGTTGEEAGISMHLSTEKVGDLVLLRIDRLKKQVKG